VIALPGYSLLPNTAALEGLDDARAMAALFSPRYLAYASEISGSVRQPTYVLLRDTSGPLVSLLGVTHAIGRATPPGWPVVWSDARVAIAANPAPIPRAFVPSEIVMAETLDGARAALPRASAEVAIVESPSALPAGAGRVERLGERLFRAEMQSTGLVVFTDAYAEGWRAFVDGEPVRVNPVDVLFRGVVVPEGIHEIRFSYRPLALTLGILLSCAACGLWLALVVLPLVARQRDD
jgi:hypothetical protein